MTGSDEKPQVLRLHATCVQVEGRGVLISGPSGCGKSDLALRLLENSRAVLVADDYVELSLTSEGGLCATCPPALAGLIEARHVGVLRVPFVARAAVVLCLEPCAAPERLPEPATRTLLGVVLPCLRLPYLEASTVAKVRRVVVGELATGA